MLKSTVIALLILSAVLGGVACSSGDDGEEDQGFPALHIPLVPEAPIAYTTVTPSTPASEDRLDPVVLVAMFSTPGYVEGERRAGAARELMTQLRSYITDVDYDAALDLLKTIAPEAGIRKHRPAAKRLAGMSALGDLGDWGSLICQPRGKEGLEG